MDSNELLGLVQASDTQLRTPSRRTAVEYDIMIALSGLVPERAIMVEVGSHYGDSTLGWLLTGRFSSITCVDPFVDVPGIYEGMQNVFGEFNRRVIQKFPEARLLRCSSVEAARHMEDRSLDLVYIDGDHSYEAVKSDILCWLPKVKHGGYIAGHDFVDNGVFGVQQAVREFLGEPLHVDGNGSWYFKVEVKG